MRNLALIPAHNEEATIADAVAGVKDQVDTVYVVADNCTDATVSKAEEAGARVFVTEDNTDKKAGALNQSLDYVLGVHDPKVVLVQDADTVIDPRFMLYAGSSLSDKNIGAVGGVFYGEDGGGLLGQLQRNEYTRYAREVARKKAKASVLTGTATAFRADVLREVRRARLDSEIPTGSGGYYDTLSLTEDSEITLAVKTLGYKTVSPRQCRVTTEVMHTLPELWKQRVRWQRGALENLKNYGLTKVTAKYFWSQTMMGLSVLALLAFLFVFFVGLALFGFHTTPFWLGIGAVFLAERVVTVLRGGPKAVGLALAMPVELLYDCFQHAVYLSCLAGLIRNTKQEW